jgi:cytochrome c oxidase subunit 2
MVRRISNYRRLFAALLTFMALPGVAFAQAVGAPKPWEMGMQAAYGPLKRDEIWLHNIVLVIITLITLFVAGLLVWVIYRYNAKRNPVPSRTSHNTLVEVLWTVIPVVILVGMAIPSFRLVYFEDRTHDPQLTIKVTGHQWYWEYTYPDNNNIDFSSYIIPDDQLKPGQMRLLTVDNELVIPINKNIRILATRRTIETWMRADTAGTFYGECNQICGTNHSRMPIVVRAVPEQEFNAWLAQAKTKFASETPQSPDTTNEPRQQVASAGVQH